MAIQFVTGQYKDLSISNDKLAGSIANAKLSNSAVTLAGLAVSLGGTIADSALAAALPLDLIGAAGAAVSLNSQKITSLATPTADSDAATKAYVDSVVQGLDIKDSVKAASTANLTLSGTQTVDGVALVADDRILVKDQTTGSQNGIYIVAVGSWARSADFAVGEDEAGAFCFVEQGTIASENGYACTNNKGSGVVGTDALVFAQFSGAGQVIAGAGLAKSGNTLSVNVDDSSLEINSDALRIKASGVTDAMLAGSISNGKLSNSSVSYGGVSLALGATDATPAFDLVDATNYPTSSLVGTITNTQLAGSIANAKLANSSVSYGGVSLALGASDATPAFDLSDATSYPTSSLVGTITNAQLAGSINAGKLLIDSANLEVMSGGADDGKLAIKLTSITNDQLAGSIANGKLANSSVTIAGKSVALGASISLEALTLAANSGMAISGSYDGSTARTIQVSLSVLAAAAIAPSTDSIAFIDSLGASKKESVADFMTAIAGDSLGVNAFTKTLDVICDEVSLTTDSDAIEIKDLGVAQAKMKMRPYSEVQTANGSTSVFSLDNSISDGNLSVWKSGVQVFRNGQRIKLLLSGSPADASEYTVANDGATTKVTLGGNPANGELMTFDYMTDA
jgi:hypothetical protein